MKTTTLRFIGLTTAVPAVLAPPAQLRAQRADSVRTHVVRPGDTLWKLSATYLGEGSRWREILALNASVREAQSLTVGDTIRIPGTAATRAPAPSEVDTFVPTKPEATTDSHRTVFYGTQPGGGLVPPDSTRIVHADSTVPAGVYEALSAPFVGDSLVFAASGRCVGPAAGGVPLAPRQARARAVRRWRGRHTDGRGPPDEQHDRGRTRGGGGRGPVRRDVVRRHGASHRPRAVTTRGQAQAGQQWCAGSRGVGSE